MNADSPFITQAKLGVSIVKAENPALLRLLGHGPRILDQLLLQAFLAGMRHGIQEGSIMAKEILK